MKKLFSQLFSYKTWAFAAAVVTVLMAFPVLQEYIKSSPKIEVSVGNYLITDESEITLLYVVPDTEIDKYQVPLPISFINAEKTAIHNFLGKLSTKMLKVYSNDKKDGYMKRFLCINEQLNNQMQSVYIKSATIVNKGKIELAYNGYELNLVRKNKQQDFPFSFDDFDFNLEITYDNQEKNQNIHFKVLCMCESQYQKMALNKEKLDSGMTFAIFTEAEHLAKQEDGIKIMKCKLKEIGDSVTKI